MRKKFFAGGLLKTGPVIRQAVNNPEFKNLKKRIINFLDKAYKSKNGDPYLKKQEFKVRTGDALEKAMNNFVKEKGFSKENIESGKKALQEIKKYNQQKKMEAKEYILSKGKTKN